MNRINYIFAGLSLLFVNTLSAQKAVVDSAATALEYKMEVYQKENIPFKKPIPYPTIREADVVFEKTVWRMVDLREKQNLSLYYPTSNIGSRVSLVNLLLKGVESGEITAYSTDDVNNEFVSPMTKEQLDVQFGARNDTIMVVDEDGNMVEQPRNTPRRIEEVKMLMIKEKIYFDKRHSVLNRMVIGICPIRLYSRDSADPDAPIERVKTMWVYVPEARPIMARHPVFNRNNDTQNISFDDFFMQHRYSGPIYQISNVYNNRTIEEYASGLDVMYEAQRIENEIFDWEQDLWEY